MISDSTTTASTTSPTPISPFSTYSVHSEPTSDELPDLGAFTTVFRALNHLQPPPQRSFPILIPGSTDTATTTNSTRVTISHSAPRDSIISAYYLGSNSNHRNPADTDSPSDDDDDYGSGSGSDTEGEPEGRLVEIEGFSDVDADGHQPSLGYLDEALSFIASERARYTAQRDKGTAEGAGGGAGSSAWRHVVEPRRKRRRKKSKVTPTSTTATTTEGGEEEDDSPSSSLSSLDLGTSPPSAYPFHRQHNYKSTPGTPGRRRQQNHHQHHRRNGSLRHSKSTPNLLESLSVSTSTSVTVGTPALDPRVIQLRSLAHKLRLFFPEDAAALNTILSNDPPGRGEDFVDPRGPAPRSQDTLIHVFIDHSNILIGLLNYLKRHHPHPHPHSTHTTHTHTSSPTPRKPKHMSHAALALILERGRPITRRCVVTSSPLYQPMESAEQLGYEVRVYARVPDLGDGEDRRRSGEVVDGVGVGAAGGVGAGKGHWRKISGGGSGGGGSSSFRKGHGHKGSSGGNTSTESEQGAGANLGFPQAFIRSLGSQTTIRPTGSNSSSQQLPSTATATNPSTTATATTTTTNAPNTPPAPTTPPVRIRYREQGVDELLQLKLHQALADIDGDGTPPPNATIVLATGDGNVGQFNDDGFLGPVRTALKKGWKVELYAWEEGLSKAWKREFGKGSGWEGRFRIIGMETFGVDLMEV